MCPPAASKRKVIQQEKVAASYGMKGNVGTRQLKPYEMELTPKQMLLTALPAFIAFALGVLTRVHYAENGVAAVRITPNVVTQGDDVVKLRERADMPKPVLPSWKKVPETIYTFREFETDNEHIPAYGYLDVPVAEEQQNSCNADENECEHVEKDGDGGDEKDEDEDDEEHLPAGQHLLVDIKNVEADFLNSDVRLAQAMIDVVNESKLTLLSYHCHSLLPMGVSCVGVLLESHISFHTWPTEGVITLDLFTCGSGKLMPVLPILERLFGIPRTPKDGESFVAPFARWVHKLRGFRPEESKDYLSRDLGIEVLENTQFEWKQEVSLMSRCIPCRSMR
jgi:S-adenosylmethionine decarboxylase proenzyme